MMTLITILLFCFGIIMCIIKEYTDFMPKNSIKANRKKKKRYFILNDSFYEYIITITATVLGVTLAIICTNYDTGKKDKNDTIEFLEILNEELLSKEKNIISLIGLNQISSGSDNDIDVLKTITFSPVLPLEVILTSDPYVSTLSSNTYRIFLTKRVGLEMEQNGLLNASSSFDAEGYLLDMAQDMEFIRSVIEIEFLYQNNDITEQEVESKIDELNLIQAKEDNNMLLEMLKGLEDSEWKSEMIKLLEAVDEMLN